MSYQTPILIGEAISTLAKAIYGSDYLIMRVAPRAQIKAMCAGETRRQHHDTASRIQQLLENCTKLYVVEIYSQRHLLCVVLCEVSLSFVNPSGIPDARPDHLSPICWSETAEGTRVRSQSGH